MSSQSLPFRAAPGSGVHTPERKGSVDSRNEVHLSQNHYIGIDVGTGSARACIINEAGDIVGLSSENIGLWQTQTGYYVRTIHHKDSFWESESVRMGADVVGYRSKARRIYGAASACLSNAH
jgi:glycerol kinase